MTKKTYRQKIIERLQGLQSAEEQEDTHQKAVDVLCELLIEIGYEDVVAAYKDIDIWY